VLNFSDLEDLRLVSKFKWKIMNIRYISIHTKIHITFKYYCDHILFRNKKIKNKIKVKKQIGGNNHDLQQKNRIKRYKM